jgi:hypothetical protein
MKTVWAVDIGRAWLTEPSGVAPGFSPEAVGGRIVGGVGLGLDDYPADTPPQLLGDQVACHRHRVTIEEVSVHSTVCSALAVFSLDCRIVCRAVARTVHDAVALRGDLDSI